MKIVIVGAGKIGSAIVKHVSEENHEVIVIDDNPEVIEKIVNQCTLSDPGFSEEHNIHSFHFLALLV